MTGGTGVRARLAPHPTDEHHKVTTLELFFDLVFVFAITQVTAYMAADLDARRVVEGLVLVALLWFAWCCYAWLGNQARADVGLVRVVVLVAMGGLFLVALAIPEAYRDTGAGLSAPLLLALAVVAVRLAHLAVYAEAAAGDSALRRQLARTSTSVVAACVLLVAGALVGGDAQLVLWVLALAVDYGGIYFDGTGGWRLPAPGHFAERHGLILIIALGESIVAIGVGVSDLPVTAAVCVAALLGLLVTVALWWLYFDVVAPVAESVLARLQGRDRALLARDSYTYLHLPMVAGVIVLAVGLKKVVTQVADTEHYDLSKPLSALALGLLYGGVVVYLLAHIAFRLRNTRTGNPHRSAVAALLVVLAVPASRLPALGALALLAAVLGALVAYEVARFADARRQLHAHLHDGGAGHP